MRRNTLVGAAVVVAVVFVMPRGSSTSMMGRHGTDSKGRHWYVECQSKNVSYAGIDWQRDLSVTWQGFVPGQAPAPPLTWDGPAPGADVFPDVDEHSGRFGDISALMLDAGKNGQPMTRTLLRWQGLPLQLAIPLVLGCVAILIVAGTFRLGRSRVGTLGVCNRCGYRLVRQNGGEHSGKLICPECGPKVQRA